MINFLYKNVWFYYRNDKIMYILKISGNRFVEFVTYSIYITVFLLV